MMRDGLLFMMTGSEIMYLAACEGSHYLKTQVRYNLQKVYSTYDSMYLLLKSVTKYSICNCQKMQKRRYGRYFDIIYQKKGRVV